ncbi:lantibiotic dehydratase [Kitasatospora sp. NPDC092948]|uniref:lantibiotic dehydratase n=1 Tax=Kitasatospora sp. NPDC092948 TaxID=3364088 RepID=UPI0038100507
MAGAARVPYYRPLSAAVRRASAWATRTQLPPWPGDAADAGSWRAWIARLWAVHEFRDAGSLVSPALADRVGHAPAPSPFTVARLHRTGISVARQLIRATTRATPFGVFASAGPVRFDDRR